MNDKVTAIRGGTLGAFVHGEPVPEVVARLEHALDLAKKGEIAAVALVGIGADMTQMFMLKDFHATTEAHAVVLLGGLRVMETDLAERVLDSGDDEE